MSDCPLELRDVSRVFRSGDASLHVLRGADLSLRAGEIVALVAPSGVGKSTLLHLAGLLERPDGGAVLIDGRDGASWRTASAPRSAATASGSSISSIICCPSSPRWKTLCCRR